MEISKWPNLTLQWTLRSHTNWTWTNRLCIPVCCGQMLTACCASVSYFCVLLAPKDCIQYTYWQWDKESNAENSRMQKSMKYEWLTWSNSMIWSNETAKSKVPDTLWFIRSADHHHQGTPLPQFHPPLSSIITIYVRHKTPPPKSKLYRF